MNTPCFWNWMYINEYLTELVLSHIFMSVLTLYTSSSGKDCYRDSKLLLSVCDFSIRISDFWSSTAFYVTFICKLFAHTFIFDKEILGKWGKDNFISWRKSKRSYFCIKWGTSSVQKETKYFFTNWYNY